MECLVCFTENSSHPLNSHQLYYCNYFCNLLSLDNPQFLLELQESPICTFCLSKFEEIYVAVSQLRQIKIEFKELLLESQRKSFNKSSIEADCKPNNLRNKICDEITGIDQDLNSFSNLKYIEFTENRSPTLNSVGLNKSEVNYSEEIYDQLDNEDNEEFFIPQNDREIKDEINFDSDTTYDEVEEMSGSSSLYESMVKEALSKTVSVNLKKLEDMSELELNSAKGQGPTTRSSRLNNKRIIEQSQNPNESYKKNKSRYCTVVKIKSKPKPLFKPKTIKCKFETCTMKFRCQSVHDAHYRRAHEGIFKCYICHICEKSYSGSSKYYDHMRIHKKGPESIKRYYCDKCEKSYLDKRALSDHIKIVHETPNEDDYQTCDLCGKSVLKTKMKGHLNMHYNLTKYTCEQCGRKFTSIGVFKSHQIRHTIGPGQEKPFPCAHCKNSFATHNSLCSHVRRFHTIEEDRIFSCDQCEFKTAMISQLTHHKHMVHLTRSERPFICDWEGCGRGFMNSNQLKNHKNNKHENIRPVKCQLCKKGFFTKRNLESHMKLHQKDAPFMCELCGKKYKIEAFFKFHLKWHKSCEERGITPIPKPRKKKIIYQLVDEENQLS